jgi:hypothetical protein
MSLRDITHLSFGHAWEENSFGVSRTHKMRSCFVVIRTDELRWYRDNSPLEPIKVLRVFLIYGKQSNKQYIRKINRRTS